MTVDVEWLARVDPFGDVALIDASRDAVLGAVPAWTAAGFAVAIADGTAMGTDDALFAEFARAMEFPDYFGHTWPALDDCLGDLNWLSLDIGVVLVVLDAHEVLGRVKARHREDRLALLMRLLHDAANTFATPVTVGEWWDRPAIPFHVVLQSTDRRRGDAERRWQRAGAMLRRETLPPTS